MNDAEFDKAVFDLMWHRSLWASEVIDKLRLIALRHGITVVVMPTNRNQEVAGMWFFAQRRIEIRWNPVLGARDVANFAHEVAHMLRSDRLLVRAKIPKEMVQKFASEQPPPPTGVLEYSVNRNEEDATNHRAYRLIKWLTRAHEPKLKRGRCINV